MASIQGGRRAHSGCKGWVATPGAVGRQRKRTLRRHHTRGGGIQSHAAGLPGHPAQHPVPVLSQPPRDRCLACGTRYHTLHASTQADRHSSHTDHRQCSGGCLPRSRGSSPRLTTTLVHSRYDGMPDGSHPCIPTAHRRACQGSHTRRTHPAPAGVLTRRVPACPPLVVLASCRLPAALHPLCSPRPPFFPLWTTQGA